MTSGLRLFTRDSRRCGNAIITGSLPHPQLGTIYQVETDFGNISQLTALEIRDLYFTTDNNHQESHCDPARWHADKERLAIKRQLGDTLPSTIETAVPCHESIQALLAVHEILLEEDPGHYFILLYNPASGWTANIHTLPEDPGHRMLTTTQGIGSTPDAACKTALDRMKPTTPVTPA